MKIKNNMKVFAILLIGLLIVCSFLSIVRADTIGMPTGNEIVPITRYESRWVLMDPGKTYTIYYVADGKPATMEYKESLSSYLLGKNSNEKSIIAMSIYYALWFDKSYSSVKNTAIDLFPQKTSLPNTQGVYKFEYRAYGHSWAYVNFKVS